MQHMLQQGKGVGYHIIMKYSS